MNALRSLFRSLAEHHTTSAAVNDCLCSRQINTALATKYNCLADKTPHVGSQLKAVTKRMLSGQVTMGEIGYFLKGPAFNTFALGFLGYLVGKQDFIGTETE